MSLEFARPLLLLLLPAYIALIYLIDRRGGRRSRRIKHRVARVMRCLLTCLCVLALAAPSVVLPGGQQAVWILADASASARGMQDQMTQSVRTALENKDASVNAGVIAFGGNAMVEKPLAQDGTYNGVTTAVDAQASDLSSALTLASALLPEDAQGRIVVLSDGATEDVRAAAQQLAARGVTVDFQSFSGDALPDAQISQLNVPSRVYQGQSFTVTVQVTANHDTAGTLVLYQNRTPVSSREVTLRRGDNTFTFRDTAADTGVVTYEARLISEGDSCAQNDSMGGYVYVQGAPKLLLVEGRQGEGSEMAAMLCAAAMQYETVLPAQLPYDAEQLRQYDGVVLVNVDYDAADEEQWAALDSAVETLLAANPISNQFEIAAMNIEYDFGLKAEDVAAYKGVKSNDNGDAGLVLVVEAASGKAQDVVTALESYKQDQVAFYGNYAEFAQAQSNVENAIISSKGDRVVMVIASNECSADLNSAVDSALNS